MKLNEDFLSRMREATRLLQTEGPAAASAAIQQALNGTDDAGSPGAAHGSAGMVDLNPAPAKAKWSSMNPFRAVMPEDAQVIKEEERTHEPSGPGHGEQARNDGEAKQDSGRFLAGSHSGRAGTRAYKLYVPASYRGEPLPLIVMLHGCKQHPDDFAAGTRMNTLAESQGCFVLYPAQARAANGSNCWNWFTPADQRRDAGEPSILAGMTRQVMAEYRIDPDRVYVAGLSAGGAMASILGATYPDLYAAIGIHSGLPTGSAHDVASAFGAMKSGAGQASDAFRQTVPAIVFHGDKDRTVHPRNGSAALAQSMKVKAGAEAPVLSSITGTAGRTYVRTVYGDGDGKPVAEYWLVRGAGHAWSGGDARGSYTDARGPDASAEMLRFFLAHPMRPH